MSKEFNLVVDKRELVSKGERKRILKEGTKVPGVYYSHDSKESIPFMVSEKVLREALKSNAQVYKIYVGNKLRDVIIKSMQYHPMTEQSIYEYCH